MCNVMRDISLHYLECPLSDINLHNIHSKKEVVLLVIQASYAMMTHFLSIYPFMNKICRNDAFTLLLTPILYPALAKAFSTFSPSLKLILIRLVVCLFFVSFCTLRRLFYLHRKNTGHQKVFFSQLSFPNPFSPVVEALASPSPTSFPFTGGSTLSSVQGRCYLGPISSSLLRQLHQQLSSLLNSYLLSSH